MGYGRNAIHWGWAHRYAKDGKKKKKNEEDGNKQNETEEAIIWFAIYRNVSN